MTEEERKEAINLALWHIGRALAEVGSFNLSDAALWDLQAAKRRVEEAREKADG